jgi:hypothetical protein
MYVSCCIVGLSADIHNTLQVQLWYQVLDDGLACGSSGGGASTSSGRDGNVVSYIVCFFRGGEWGVRRQNFVNGSRRWDGASMRSHFDCGDRNEVGMDGCVRIEGGRGRCTGVVQARLGRNQLLNSRPHSR